jgi:hypothetical protein
VLYLIRAIHVEEDFAKREIGTLPTMADKTELKGLEAKEIASTSLTNGETLPNESPAKEEEETEGRITISVGVDETPPNESPSRVDEDEPNMSQTDESANISSSKNQTPLEESRAKDDDDADNNLSSKIANASIPLSRMDLITSLDVTGGIDCE